MGLLLRHWFSITVFLYAFTENKADKVHVVPIWYYWGRGQNRGRSKVHFENKPGMVSMAEVLSRVKRAPSPSSSFCSPSIQQAVVATTLWPSVPS